jgi:hypothetical protein
VREKNEPAWGVRYTHMACAGLIHKFQAVSQTYVHPKRNYHRIRGDAVPYCMEAHQAEMEMFRSENGKIHPPCAKHFLMLDIRIRVGLRHRLGDQGDSFWCLGLAKY